MTSCYTVLYEQDETGAWTATVREVPGALTCGDTLEEVRGNVRDALDLFVEDAEVAELRERVLPYDRRPLTVAEYERMN
jgi:predicted RNase H-like HicB family nuclease